MTFMKNWLQDNLSKIKSALFKTKKDFPWEESKDISDFDITEEFFETLFEKFIKADVGIELTGQLINSLKKEIKTNKVSKADLQGKIKQIIKNLIPSSVFSSTLKFEKDNLNIYLIVGVNGSGKTTSIAKLANYFKEKDEKILIAAADTFRAAAQEQLFIWASRLNIEVIAPKETKKPDAVVYNAIEKAKKENVNVLLIDTAGRLHSQTNLMGELKKIDSVIEKNQSNSNVEKLIVLDATIGQNAIIQAKTFSEAIKLSGIILAKLDSSAKGGVVLNIMHKLSLPVKVVCTGEKIDDIAEFNFDEFLEGLI